MLTFTVDALFESVSSSRPENAYKTNREVADYLKVTERTIYRLAGAKQIPAFKVGGSWRFSKADIDRWIREQSTASADGRKGHP